MKSLRWFFSYMVVASLGLGLAFVVSLKFVAPARSQEPPSSGELPAEFLKDVESTQVPAPPPAPPGNGATPTPTPTLSPAPTAAQTPAVPGAVPSKVPPPPAEELPIGEGIAPPPAMSTSAPTVDATDFPEMPYDPAARRDPFKAFRVARPVDPLKLILEPLQKFEIEKLQVIGILWDVRVPRAMIKDPDGAVHTVIKNSKVGRNEGFVAVIREGEIVVVETLYEDGKVLKETRVMELSK